MNKIKKPLVFCLCLLPIEVVGAWFALEYSLSLIDESVIEEAVNQIGSLTVLKIVSVGQTVLYTVILGFLGYILSEKTGFMRPLLHFEKKTSAKVFAACFVGTDF